MAERNVMSSSEHIEWHIISTVIKPGPDFDGGAPLIPISDLQNDIGLLLRSRERPN